MIEILKKKEEIKTLANCNDVEFLQQTNRIRHAVEKWLTATDIANIRKRLPHIEEIPENATDEEKTAIQRRNEASTQKQVRDNISAILDACLEEHPNETLEIIRLCCFVEPNDNSHRVTFYLNAFTQMMGNEDVTDFLTSLMNLVQTLGLTR